MESLKALEKLEKKFNKEAKTVREWLKSKKTVDPSLAIAALRREIGIRIIPYGSVTLGVSNPGDIDGYVHPGDEEIVNLVKIILRDLTGLTPSLKPLNKDPHLPNPIAGKIERLALKGGEIRFYGPARFSKLIRDANHLRHIAKSASENELLAYLYALDLLEHLRRKGLTDDQISRKLERYVKYSDRTNKIKRLYPDVFTFIDKVINTAVKILKKGEAL